MLSRPTFAALALPLATLLPSCNAPSGDAATAEHERSTADRMAWWREARFGMFLHWGLYAIPAGRWGEQTDHAEWIRETAHIPTEEYDRFVPQFNPVDFDARAWVALAKRAGMQYVVITSKHHDGFCLFDSAETDYDVMSTPFHRDIMKELSDACHEAGLRMCWYHSIMDWHHPDYLPRRSWEDRPAAGADMNRYVDHLHAQVRELLSHYGPIGVMWFDGEWENTWNHEYGQALYDLCRSIQPDVIVNNRVDVGRGGMAGMTSDSRFAGDFGTPEQEIPATGLSGVDWETCMTMNDHWGYNSSDRNWKTTTDLVRKLVDIASKGGNFLLNVGPTSAGRFPTEAIERLEAIGKWMDVNGEAIHGTTASPIAKLAWGRITTKPSGGGTTLYLCVFDWPVDGRLVVPGLGSVPRGARLLAEPGRALAVSREESSVVLTLPAQAPDAICSVVALDIEGVPLVYEAPEIHASAPIFVRALEVEIRSGSPALEVRYTLDGSTPTERSPLYQTPIRLGETTTVRSVAFHQGRAVSEVTQADFELVTPRPGLAIENARPGLALTTYAGDWNQIPDFGALPARSQRVADTIGITGELAAERVGARFEGFLDIREADVYELALLSDDGSRLYLDGELAIDSDGLHSTLEGRTTLALGAGQHPLRVEWFNKTGGHELALSLARAGEKLVEIPAGSFAHLP